MGEIMIPGLADWQQYAFTTLHHKIHSAVDISEEQKAFCDTSCILRYLRARDFNISKAENMLRATLSWRQQECPQNISTAEILPVLNLGTAYGAGLDKLNRPVIYVKPGAFNPESVEMRVRYLIYLMETTINRAPPGVEQLCLVMDFSEYGSRVKQSDSRQVTMTSINILTNHYPERLGKCYLINTPWYFTVLYTMASMVLSSATKRKLQWISGNQEEIHHALSENIDEPQLITAYGGTLVVDELNH